MSSSISHDTAREIDEPSICIPRVFKHISKQFIHEIFQKKLTLGHIRRVDIISNNTNTQFKKVFIHFDYWYDNQNAIAIKNKLIDGTTLKIVYDTPWFWKCSLNKAESKPL
jgi:hypothetical protein